MIQSSETPSGARIRSSFSVRAPLESSREFEWQLHFVEVPTSKRPLLWMRPLDCLTDAGFVAYDSLVNSGEAMLFDDGANAETNLDYVFDKGNIARQLFLNEAGNLRRDNERAHEAVIFAPDGRAVWSDTFEPDPKRYPAHFRWSEPMSPANFLCVPLQMQLQRLNELLADPNGEVAFARRWALTTKQQRDEIRQQPARGTSGELETRMRDILLASSVWDENPGARQINISFNWHNQTTIWDEDGQWGESLSMPPLLAQNAETVRAHFQPFDERIGSFECVKRSDAGPLVVHVARPTAHERAEAMKRWSKWERTR